MRNYRDLQVWNKAHDLTLELYRISQRFPREEIYGITGQTAARRSVDWGQSGGRLRASHQNELARFVRIAMGSASELDYHLLLSRDLGFMAADEFTQCFNCADRSAQNAHLVLEQC